jgi:hypothetical protein
LNSPTLNVRSSSSIARSLKQSRDDGGDTDYTSS